MPDTLTTPEAPVTPASPEKPAATTAPATPAKKPTPTSDPLRQADPIREAGRNFLAKIEAQRTASPEVARTTEEESAVTPETPAETEASVLTQDAQGKWHRPDGTMASQEEIAAHTASGATESASEETPPEPRLFKLPADPQRWGNDKEMELDVSGLPQEVVERLEFMKNNQMRREEFNRRVASVEEREAKTSAFVSALRDDPVNTMLDHIPQDRQVSVMKALMLANWEPMLDILKPLADPNELKVAQLVDRHVRDRSRVDVTKLTAQQLNARRVWSQVEQMVPESASPEDTEAFLRDADRDLTDALNAGQSVTIENTKTILERRLRQYGFLNGAPAPSAGNAPVVPVAPPAPPKLAVARPKGADAEAIAQRAAETQKRIKQQQSTRSVAAAVAPQGAGALPVEREKPPKGQTIEERSKWHRERGVRFGAS